MADKYINRDKLLEAYGDCIVTYCLYPKHGTFPTYGETGLWDYIKTMPTIEVEPKGSFYDGYAYCLMDFGRDTVLCQDCKHHEDEKPGMVYCPKIVGGWVSNNFYCGDGERKGGGDNEL